MFKSSCKHDTTKPRSLSLSLADDTSSNSAFSQFIVTDVTTRHVTWARLILLTLLTPGRCWGWRHGPAQLMIRRGASGAAGGHVQHTNYRPIVSLHHGLCCFNCPYAHFCFKGSLHHLLCQLFYWASMCLRLATLCATRSCFYWRSFKFFHQSVLWNKKAFSTSKM